jgi:DNA invertase Pin-like site-specific DNA recombinase
LKKAIPYYRVSTERQGQSGLGLDAQRKAVRDFARFNKLRLLSEFTEIESGKKSKRPILLQALEQCKNNNALLLIAKLDRLGRNVAFISKLMESNVDFIAVDNPYANKLQVHIMAAFAEYERDQISNRTKEALQAAKRRGVVLGKYARTLAKTHKKRSKVFARKMRPVIRSLMTEGFESVRELTDILNEKKIATFTGNGRWHVSTVHRLLQQIKKL